MAIMYGDIQFFKSSLCQYFEKKFRNLSTSLISLKILDSFVPGMVEFKA